MLDELSEVEYDNDSISLTVIWIGWFGTDIHFENEPVCAVKILAQELGQKAQNYSKG